MEPSLCLICARSPHPFFPTPETILDHYHRFHKRHTQPYTFESMEEVEAESSKAVEVKNKLEEEVKAVECRVLNLEI
ncbi:hypothetical protein Q3G72_007189 [Acer saccharum]|nr:hypothetical protein Q3G72_007189 [Acer saccharum]